jgi:malate dehydrogenase
VAEVTHMIIWGNHSSTQYPDAKHARIGGRPAYDVISDQAWLENEFMSKVQGRGAEIIKARGLSSAASAGNAAIDCAVSMQFGTPEGDWTSVGVVSHGEYGIPEGLVFSYPVTSNGSSWQVVEGLDLDEDAQAKIKATTDELLQEQSMVQELLGGSR